MTQLSMSDKIKMILSLILFTFICIIVLFFVGVSKVDAQSLSWTNPTYLSINNGYPGQNIELQSDNSLLVGSIGGSRYGMYTWAIYQINKNNINSNWQILDKSNYNITFESTIHTRYDVGNTLIKLLVFDNGTQYTATCDSGEVVSFERYTDNSNRYKFRYSCKELNVNLDNVSFISIGVKSNDYTIDYHFVTSNLRLIDNNLELSNKDVIENQNQNTQDIINNQNNNQGQTNERLDNIDNSLNDSNINNNDVNNSLSQIEDKFEDNGVITSLLTLPVTLYSSVLNSLTSNSCTSFNLGSLFGTDLILPCFNIKDFLGSALTTSIDIMISGFFVYSIRNVFVKIFDKFSSLEEGDILD